MHNHGIILVSCPDRPGIVADISGFVHEHGGNIVHLDQHIDGESGTFFLRLEWDLAGFGLSRGDFHEAFAPRAEKFRMDWSLRFTNDPLNVAVLVSKQDHCLWDLFLRHRAGELPGHFPLVVSNHPDLRHVATGFGVYFEHVPVEKGGKPKAEARLNVLLEEHRVDLVVLARYMQILSPQMVARWPSRIINVHHSFLPAFSGARPYHQAHEHGVKVIGATSHYVTVDLDEGPIISQVVTATSHRDEIPDLVRKGKDLEKLALARAVALHLRHRILVLGRKTVVIE